MDLLLRQNYIQRVVSDLDGISGANFERVGYIISDRIAAPLKLWHRGTNLQGAPVGYTVDTFSEDGKWIGEYSTEKGYFTDSSKPIKDTRHAVTQRGGKPETVYLLSNQACPPSRLGWVARWIRRLRAWHKINISIWDVTKIAEFIVDELLLDDSAVDALSTLLPSVLQFHNEAALSLLLPNIDKDYIHRVNVERVLTKKLEKDHYLVIWGLSGVGKSALAKAIAWQTYSQYQLVIWVDARDVNSIHDLSAIDLRRNGHHLNVMGLLIQRRCLLVLDDASAIFDVDEMRRLCGTGSFIIVTRQTKSTEYDVSVPSLDKDTASTILNHKMGANRCPDRIFKRIFRELGGYALIYRLLNINVFEHGYAWEDVEADLDAIAQYQDEKGRHLAARLLGRAAESMSKELSFLKGCGVRSVDREFAKYVIRPVGISNLVRWGLVDRAEPELIIVHDIIIKVLEGIDILPQNLRDLLQKKLREDIESNWIGFLRITKRHINLIRQYAEQKGHPVFLYAYLHRAEEREISTDFLENILRVESVQQIAQSDDPEISALAVLEANEVRYRMEKAVDIEHARNTLREQLYLFDLIIDQKDILSAHTLLTVEHHKAKALKIVGNESEALNIFKRISESPYPLPEAQLQLARLYAKSQTSEDTKAAVRLIESILKEGQLGNVSHSIILAAVDLCRWKRVRDAAPNILEGYDDWIASIIMETAAFSPDQAIHSFMSIAGSWSFKKPELFLTVFQALPPPDITNQTSEDDTFAWAEVLREAARAYVERIDDIFNLHLNVTNDDSTRVITEAITLYRQLKKPNSFRTRRYAEAMYRSGDYDNALLILDSIEAGKEEPWRTYWKAKCLYAIGDETNAFNEINSALHELNSNPTYMSAFLHCKAEIEDKLGDVEALNTINEAIKWCSDNRYCARLEKVRSQILANQALQGSSP